MYFYGFYISQGVDIISMDRVEFKNEKLLQRFLTSKEYNDYQLIVNPKLKKEFVAGHWAAKEAIIKALEKKVLMHQLEIFHEYGRPGCNLGNYQISLSISHENDYVVATALVVVAVQ